VGRLWIAVGVVALGFLVWGVLRRGRRRRPEQAVILTLRLADSDTPAEELSARLRQLDDALRAAVSGRVGEVEEPFGQGVECIYTCYGPDADRLFDAVAVALRGTRLQRGSSAVRRYGGPGAPEERVELAAPGR
jgi:hypothetical protein